MKRSTSVMFFLLLTLGIQAGLVRAQSTEFTYQGKLTVAGAAANGQYDLQFRLFDAEAGGTEVSGPPFAVENAQVTAGIFTVGIDFGQAFPLTESRWLQIEVRPGDSTGAYTPLTPRQKMTAAPYAVTASSAETANTANDSAAVGGFTPDQLVKEGDARLTDARQPLDGSPSYVQIGPPNPQSGGFNVLGNGRIGSSLSVWGATILNSNLSVGGTITGNGSGLTNVAAQTATTALNSNNLGGVAASEYLRFKWNVVASNTNATSNQGYIINESGEIELLLPAAPQVGDVVRVVETGTGSFLVRLNSGQSIVRTDGDLLAPWIAVESSRNWFSVASSADGTRLIAGVLGGRLYTSQDSGRNWIPREANRSWWDVASSADGTKLVAVANEGGGGQIYTSDDLGNTWIPRENNRFWWGVASSADGTKLVAVADSERIYTSTDSGVNWTPRDTAKAWRAVASSADGTKLVAVAANNLIYTSTDSGTFWTPTDSVRAWISVASSADGTKLAAAVANGQIYTSTDSGSNWTPRESNRNWSSITSSADGTKLAAVVAGGKIYVSTNSGATWTAQESDRNWLAVTSSADGSKIVAGSGGQIYLNPRAVAGFGLTGTSLSSAELIYVGGGKFLLINSTGKITLF